ncbi:WD40/YVTN/BNR-like repeat-containing protein [Pseudoduganella sp. GCM10020061]|uniref:WD40/YVTN/BNR-like repeat-containing protein n=1 Tax=Pseudoduganella sp. GCM10020061 TaxID=3317345 RepID=UPI003641ED8D
MGDRAFVSTRKGLFELSRRGGAWEIGDVHFRGDPVSMTLHDRRDGTLYAALNLGHFGVKLHRRDPGSAAWTEIAVPVYPPKPDGSEDKTDWSLKMIWSLEAGGDDQPGVLWAGTLPGGLFKSEDRGSSWELVRALWDQPGRPGWFGGGYDTPGIHSICVDPRDSREILVAISSAGVWRTVNGGLSWSLSAKGLRAEYMPPEMQFDEVAQDPHRMVRCKGQPDHLWIQHHNGIFRSTDNGRNWTELKAPDSSFGFAVAVDPADGNRAWFVPAEKDERRFPVGAAMSVHRTRGDGSEFDQLRNGLPQEHCYDLVYRHGLAVDDDGKGLLVGSTTGGLWASADGGDSWKAVSNLLPPVYAVSFW